jgi:hypothetical protein
MGVTVTGRCPPSVFDSTTLHHARMYDYLLRGKDDFAADREAAWSQPVSASPGWSVFVFETVVRH